MSTVQIKHHLKAARESISRKDYKKALELARKVLSFEPSNYNAQVFAGLSLLHLDLLDESEKAYREAIRLNASNSLAWQGLVNLFEKTEDLAKLKEASVQLVSIFSERFDNITAGLD
jgi:superkiller protein 3